MPAPKSVSEIKSALLRPALTSHFEVEVPFPSALRGIIGTDQGSLNLSCSEASLPGSQLATLELNNDHTGVTEKHAYRRQFDDRIDLTFYVDAGNYTAIRFFESWISYIMNEDLEEPENQIASRSYNYRARYPNEYIMDQGLKVTKFERDYRQQLTYNFVRAFPLSISSMPVSFDASSLLKVTVSMSYIRYYITELNRKNTTTQPQVQTPGQQAQFNASNLTLPGLDGAGALSLEQAAVNERFLGPPKSNTFLGEPLNSQQTLNELYGAGRSGKIKSAGDFIGPLQ